MGGDDPRSSRKVKSCGKRGGKKFVARIVIENGAVSVFQMEGIIQRNLRACRDIFVYAGRSLRDGVAS